MLSCPPPARTRTRQRQVSCSHLLAFGQARALTELKKCTRSISVRSRSCSHPLALGQSRPRARLLRLREPCRVSRTTCLVCSNVYTSCAITYVSGAALPCFSHHRCAANMCSQHVQSTCAVNVCSKLVAGAPDSGQHRFSLRSGPSHRPSRVFNVY